MKNFLNKIKIFWWVVTGRCKYCGGETWDWDSRKSYCDDCDMQQ